MHQEQKKEIEIGIKNVDAEKTYSYLSPCVAPDTAMLPADAAGATASAAAASSNAELAVRTSLLSGSIDADGFGGAKRRNGMKRKDEGRQQQGLDAPKTKL